MQTEAGTVGMNVFGSPIRETSRTKILITSFSLINFIKSKSIRIVIV